jgi:glycosyltransferase involved in cell wall biosynthesis
MKPLVSVVVTAFNHGRYIAETLKSVFQQTYSQYEVIVVDDGSTDDTALRIHAFGSKVQYVRQENQGPAGSRNTGVRLATGDLVALLDGDDLWAPTKLEAQVVAARENPDGGLIAANGVQFDEGGVIRDSLIPSSIRELIGLAQFVNLPAYEHFLRGNPVPTTSQTMIPRRILEEVGPSDLAFPLASDWDLYLRISGRYDVTFLRDKTVFWRYLSTSASGPSHLRMLHWATDEMAILRKHLRRAPDHHRPLLRALLKEKRFRTAQTAYHSGRAHDRRWATRFLLSHLARNPTSGAAVMYLAALSAPPSLARVVTRLVRAATGWPPADSARTSDVGQ